MAFLKVKNRAFSTLASGISDSDLSLTVATGEGALFPSTYPFHITIEDEILECTNRSTDVLTVTREAEGTTAAAHIAGKAVELRITAEIITRLQKQLWDDDGDTGIQVEESADEDIIRMDVGGTEAVHISAIGVQTLAKQSRAKAGRAANFHIATDAWIKLPLTSEVYDEQNEMDVSVKSGAADATEANKLHDADGGFAAGDVGKWVYNKTDHTYTTVSGFVDSGELDLTDDIMADTEEYEIYHSRFTATEPGYYAVKGIVRFGKTLADKWYFAGLFKNDVSVASGGWQAAVGDASAYNYVSGLAPTDIYLEANDYIDLRAYTNQGSVSFIAVTTGQTSFSVHKLS